MLQTFKSNIDKKELNLDSKELDEEDKERERNKEKNFSWEKRGANVWWGEKQKIGQVKLIKGILIKGIKKWPNFVFFKLLGHISLTCLDI